MLEGKEVVQKFGEKGELSVDVTPDGFAEVKMSYNEKDYGVETGSFAKLDVIILLQKLAAKTENTLDDKLVAEVAKRLGRA